MNITFKNIIASSQDFTLTDVGPVNVILGKNGCGKSTVLRSFEAHARNQGNIKYIPPERGGELVRDGNFENASQNEDWVFANRLKNRFEQFRQSTVTEFGNLENTVLREIEKNEKTRLNLSFTFDDVVQKLNALLDNIVINRAPGSGFSIQSKSGTSPRKANTLSSGEAELMSLGIEILSFAYISGDEKFVKTNNWLLFDEPDVHLHPDLQHKLMRLLIDAIRERPIRALIATHSTSIVSALADEPGTKIAFMKHEQTNLKFEGIKTSLRTVMPIFGSHPLSNVFNDRPILLVEGEDDERIWQQAVRSSGGNINVWPCAAGDKQSLAEYENKAAEILASVYDNATAYSLRDRDEAQCEIDDIDFIVRTRLNCRAAENLILSDDVLALMKTNWEELRERLDKWVEQNPEHSQIAAMVQFRDAGWDRQNADLKLLRNILLAVAGSNKPWEVIVGQAIAGLKNHRQQGDNSLDEYLGPKIIAALQI